MFDIFFSFVKFHLILFFERKVYICLLVKFFWNCFTYESISKLFWI